MSRLWGLLSCGFLLVLTSALAACSSGGPVQIATYPRSTPSSQNFVNRIYDTSLELEVADVDRAAKMAIRLVDRCGGWLIESSSSTWDGTTQTTLLLAVPAYRAETFRSSLLNLGTPLQQHTTSRLTGEPIGDQNTFSYFTIEFRSRDRLQSNFPQPGWRPLQTLVRAWSVARTIFGFLVDAMIWILVILGPFILIGLAVRSFLRYCPTRDVNKI